MNQFNYTPKSKTYTTTFRVRHGQSFEIENHSLDTNARVFFKTADSGYVTYFVESTEPFSVKVEGCTIETKIYEPEYNE